MFNKFFLIFFGVIIFTFQAFSEEAKERLPDKLSLENAIAIALRNNLNLAQKNIHLEIAKKEKEKAKWQKVPDIYANFDLKRNLIIPTTPVPAKAFNPSSDQNEIIPLRFMTNWNSNVGLNAKVDLFNPTNFGKVKEAQQEINLKNTDKEITEVQIAHQIKIDYITCIIAQEQLNLAVSDTLNKQQMLSNSETKYHLGKVKMIELNEAKAIKNEALSSYFEALGIFNNTQSQLLLDMGVSVESSQKIQFSNTLDELLSNYQKEDEHKTESLTLKKWKQQKELTEIQLKNTKVGYSPSLSLYAFYGANYFDNRFNFIKNSNWYGNSYIGLSVNLPITQGLERVKQMDILKLQTKSDQLNYQTEQTEIEFQINRAYNNLQIKEKNLVIKADNKLLQKQNLDLATEQYESGKLTNSDWLKFNQASLQSITSYFQAVYEYLQIKMELERLIRE